MGIDKKISVREARTEAKGFRFVRHEPRRRIDEFGFLNNLYDLFDGN